MQNKISRRQFLQVTGASAAVLLLAGLPVEPLPLGPSDRYAGYPRL